MINKLVEDFQEQEMLHWHLYDEFSKNGKEEKNRAVLAQLAQIEKVHYEELEKWTGKQSILSRKKMRKYIFLSRILGMRFVLKYLEKKEDRIKEEILKISKSEGMEIPAVITAVNEEDALAEKLYDEKLLYVSAIVLGLNDAVVELSGALAGYTLAIANPRAIGVIGLITGIAAALSMGIAEYLSVKEDPNSQLNYNRAAFYTGTTYILAVILLVAPYFMNIGKHISLVLMVGIDIFLVFIFNYYISITTGADLMKRFLRMTAIVLSVAAISFIMGYLVQEAFGVNI